MIAACFFSAGVNAAAITGSADRQAVEAAQAGASLAEVGDWQIERPRGGAAVRAQSTSASGVPNEVSDWQPESQGGAVSLPSRAAAVAPIRNEVSDWQIESQGGAVPLPSRAAAVAPIRNEVSDWQVESRRAARRAAQSTLSPPESPAAPAPVREQHVQAAPAAQTNAAPDTPAPASPAVSTAAPQASGVLSDGNIVMLPEDRQARAEILKHRRRSDAEVLGWLGELNGRYVPPADKAGAVPAPSGSAAVPRNTGPAEAVPTGEGELVAAPDAAAPLRADGQLAIELNGERLEGVFARKNAQGTLLLPLQALAKRIGDVLAGDAQGARVRYRRKADGARFALNLKSGEVTANGNAVGFLPEVGQIRQEQDLYPANAVQVFAGLLLEQDPETGLIRLSHDPRLRMETGFELYVNGQLLPYLNPEPRAIGHVLLLPLRPVVEELGSRLTVSEGGNRVTVVRQQDNAEISLNLSTGLVTLDGVPQGTAPEVSYADPVNLLVPREVLATLTGTYVTLVKGTRRIDVDLDDELARIIAPGSSVRERVKDAPPVLESAEIFTDTEHRASARLKGYYSQYTMQFEYETPSTQGEDGYRADWLQLRTETIDGSGLLLGDQNLSRRELQGVASGRMRGAYLYNPVAQGLLVASLGRAHTDNETLDNGESVATFSGNVAGLRFYDSDGQFEAGLAAREEDGYRALVASIHDSYAHPDFAAGALDQRLELAAGVYDQGQGLSPGGQFSWDARLKPHERLSLSATAGYTSEEVMRGMDPDTLSDDYDDDLADYGAYGLHANYRMTDSASATLAHTRSLRGLLAGEPADDVSAWTETNSAGLSWRTGRPWYMPWTYFGVSRSTAAQSEATLTRQAQASWRRDEWSLLLRHDDRRTGETSHAWQSSAELSRDPWLRRFRRGASLSVSPRVNLWKPSSQLRAEAGVLATLSSGDWLGKNTRGVLSYAHNLGITSVLDDSGEEDEELSEVTGSDYVSATLRYRFNRLLRLDSRYYSDLDGYDDFYAALTAFYEFNPPRRYRISRENAGLLTGAVFLDQNGDGQRQAGEPGLAGARVAIGGTRVGLNADSDGRFTIQNMPDGVYRVHADTTRLPLGYVADAAAVPPVRIDDGMITELAIPVMRGSQLSGAVYIDVNRNGKLDADDERPENIGLELDSGDESASTLFGQFTFDYLRPGPYRLRVQSDTLPDGVQVAEDSIDLTLQPGVDNHRQVRLLRPAD
ncbi:hypothetical protein Q4485_10585 [Granulosicoccaceae sp. 1_MG-2023]|nr:hypothetical protein [Granulosicoccaceae sp. 1_MG-2023]